MLRLLALLPLLLSASIASAAERTVAFAIDNMTCALCPVTVRTAMKQVPGVKDVQVDFESRRAIVVFEDTQSSVEEIAEASRLAGYPAVPEE